jgi:hypothetical protein
MELYILDNQLRRVQVIDKFESLIWTERFNSVGDFQLTVHATNDTRKTFMQGIRFAMNESKYVMEIETVEDSTDDEGRATLKIIGPSLEYLMQQRIARYALADDLDIKWISTDVPAAIAREIFHHICVVGTLNANDTIPYINEGSSGIFPVDTTPEPSDIIDYEMDPMTVYDAVKKLCDVYDMGFRLFRNYDLSELWFDIYMGSDRTSQQLDYPAVIFSSDLDNLKNTSQVATNANYKNVAIVISPVGTRVVYSTDVDSSVSGFDRRVMVVTANDITDVVPATANARMDQRGTEELAKAKKFSGFDGELTSNGQYRYGRDYFLGDLVELRSVVTGKSIMQVTEQIFVSDKEGDRSYPTLEIQKFVIPGSWDDAPADLVWDDAAPTHHWDDGL